ncbi:DUF2786 domain-containing protein [Sphingobium sp.]|uniref:DUF2786 domain-containing protein n=1 Tax=Sphingobium sp. TaxID=1912891 RepID=UPI00257AEF64|nr:DUF2786 domain-containing protein [Sphingobium sp.]
MEDQNIDPKVIARIKKMLHLANHGSANEGEANNAAEMAQKIMMEHNISMAMVEGASVDGAGRKKSVDEGNAKFAFQRELMVACAEVNFVFQEVNYNYRGTYKKATGYTLIGREANVVACKTLFEYLFQTIDRLGLDYVGGDASQAFGIAANSFKEGCAARIGERLRDRHREQLAEQARQAREANAAARHPSSTSTALAVVMTDYAQDERDSNEDLRLGKPEGFTKHKRLMATKRAEVVSAIEGAMRPLNSTVGDRDVLLQAARAGFEALVANRSWTVDDELEGIFDQEFRRELNYHMDAYNQNVRWAKLTPLQKQREIEKEQRASDRYWNAYYRRNANRREAPSGVNADAYHAGSRAGNSVGLDAQVDREVRKEIK